MINVTKRDGRKEPLNLDKLHVMVAAACEGLAGVSASQVEVNSGIQFYDGIKSSDIQEILIRSAVDLISLEEPNYQYVAARLRLFSLYKEVWGGKEPPVLLDVVRSNISLGVYDSSILDKYTEEEWGKLNSYIKHKRDLDFTFAGIQQVYDKYLVQDRVTKQRYETPQIAYMLIAATLFANYDDSKSKPRLKYVKDYYNAISTFKLSLPTPIIAGVRTPTRQYSSCVLADIDDTMDSIFSTNHAVAKYVAQRAGIGINSGRIRAEGSKVRNGEVEHTGVIPFLKVLQATTKSCTQNGIRGGASTNFFPFWHLDVEDFIVLKNNQGTEDNRVRHMDHCIQFNRLFYERYLEDKDITLFSPHEVPELYDNFGKDSFKELYEAAERKRNITKRKIPARKLLHDVAKERFETGRIYIMNIDHANTHSHSKKPIHMSNLCVEITLPTKPIQHIDDPAGDIATCILSALNLGTIKPDEYEHICDLAVRGLDALIDHQDYPVVAAKNYTLMHRSLGIGVINFAYYLAKNKMKWDSEEAYTLAHNTFEKIQYYLLKASNNLAKEEGICGAYGTSKYSAGKLPIDTYYKKVDEITTTPLLLDWESLRTDIKKYGLKNVCVTACMPAESSAVVSNATNGVEPPRDYLSVKHSKKGDLKTIVPEYQHLKNYYELLWDMQSPRPYLNHMAIIQKFVDQSISTNTSYNPLHYEGNEVPLSVLVKDILYAYSLGIKTLYYNNTYDMNMNDIEDNSGCDSGACAI